MNLDEIPAGAAVLIDANIAIYALSVGGCSPAAGKVNSAAL